MKIIVPNTACIDEEMKEVGVGFVRVVDVSCFLALSPKGKAQDFDSCSCWFESN